MLFKIVPRMILSILLQACLINGQMMKVVVCLWLLSASGSYFSFFTLAYIGTLLSVTVPAFYSRYKESVDRYCGMIHKRLSKHYKIVDKNIISRLPRSLSKDRDT